MEKSKFNKFSNGAERRANNKINNNTVIKKLNKNIEKRTNLINFKT